MAPQVQSLPVDPTLMDILGIVAEVAQSVLASIRAAGEAAARLSVREVSLEGFLRMDVSELSRQIEVVTKRLKMFHLQRETQLMSETGAVRDRISALRDLKDLWERLWDLGISEAESWFSSRPPGVNPHWSDPRISKGLEKIRKAIHQGVQAVQEGLIEDHPKFQFAMDQLLELRSLKQKAAGKHWVALYCFKNSRLPARSGFLRRIGALGLEVGELEAGETERDAV